METERRSNQRTDLDLWVDADLDGAVRVHRATDLSLGGISLSQAIPKPPGSRVSLELRIPDRDAAMRVEAEVTSVERRHGVGMRFVDLSRDQRVRLADYLLRCWA